MSSDEDILLLDTKLLTMDGTRYHDTARLWALLLFWEAKAELLPIAGAAEVAVELVAVVEVPVEHLPIL